MYYIKITFKKIIDTPLTEDEEELLWGYASVLYHNGQAYRDYDLVSSNNEFMLFATIPEKDSLDDKYNNYYATKCLGEVKEHFSIHYEIVGAKMSCVSICKCETQEWYMLYAFEGVYESPICCGNCKKPIPLYKFPVTELAKEHFDATSWRKAYSAVDILWMYCLSDRFTYKQMNKPDSALMKVGRELCESYESLTGKPFYLYLYQLYKTRKLCPVCGADWECKDKDSVVGYKCDVCKLVADKGNFG